MHRTNIDYAIAGQSITLALRDVKRDEVNTSMVLLESKEGEPRACFEIIAEIEIFKYIPTTVKIG